MPDLEIPADFVTVPAPAATIELKCVKVERRIIQAQVREKDGSLHACMREGHLILFELVNDVLQSHPLGHLQMETLDVVPFEQGMHYKVEFSK